MKLKILTLALLTAFIGMGAMAQTFPPFTTPTGYINEFGLVAGGKGAYSTGYGRPTISDLQAITSDNITFELLPNIAEYAGAAGGTDTNAWDRFTDWVSPSPTPGLDGGAWLEQNCYYELVIPAGTTGIVFTGTVQADDLDVRYKDPNNPVEPRAFIKVLENFGGWATLVNEQASLDGGPGTTFSLSLALTPAEWGIVVQAGFVMEGQNANPADDWGSITVTIDSLVLSSGDFDAPTPDPMTFANDPAAVGDSSITMDATTATDVAGVEYQFTNSTLAYASEWQADTNWVDEGPLGPPTTGTVDVAGAPDFSTLEPVWEGWSTAAEAAAIPSTFVTVNSGVATVSPADNSEFSFYQTQGAGGGAQLAPNQDYEFSFSSDNITVDGTEIGAFVKAFDGGWGEDLGQQQKVPLTGGGATQTISFTTDGGASVFYQVGFYTVGRTTGSYDVTDIELLALNLVQPGTPQGLTPLTTYDYQVRARDLTSEANTTAWSGIKSATTLAGDTTPPTPDPMTFVSSDPSPQSVKMTATTATDTSGIEYYFEAVAGGGVSSGWQDSPVYVNTGLASSTDFTYRVRARDKSGAQNTTAWSTNVVITTQPYPISVSLASDLKGFTPGTSNEDLTVHDVLKAGLQFADYANLDRRVAFDASGAAFGSFLAGDNGRNNIQTLANEYANADFEAYITSSYISTNQQVFIGFGPGDLGAFGVPDWSPNAETTNASVICQLDMTGTGVAGIWAQAGNTTNNWAYTAESVLALTPATDQRIKLSYNATANTATLEIDVNYNGTTFNPTVTVGPVAVPALTESSVYIAGDDGIILSDFEIVGGAAPIIGVTDLAVISAGGGVTVLQWTGIAGQTYDVVYKNALTAGSWTPDAPNTDIPGVAGSMAVGSTVAGDEAFFQVIAK